MTDRPEGHPEERPQGGEPPDGNGEPKFGPGGYLPERAAKRARKIVLRAPLGLQWVVGAVVVGIVVVTVGVFYLTTRGAPPGEPYVEIGPVDALRPARFDADRSVLFLAASGPVRAFIAPDGTRPVWCEQSGRLESTSGRVWSPTGRALDGGDSLAEHPTLVVDGVVYLDPTRRLEPPMPEERDVTPACT